MTRRLSVWRVLLCGIILAGMPLAAIAKHFHIRSTDVRIHLPVEISQVLGTNQIMMKSTIHEIALSELSGDVSYAPDDTIYVQLARGPEHIVYPFALTRSYPAQKVDNHFIAIRGQVIAVDQGQVWVRYAFDGATMTPSLHKALSEAPDANLSAEIAVKSNAVPVLTAIFVDQARIPQRVIEKPELKAFTHRGASNIPAR